MSKILEILTNPSAILIQKSVEVEADRIAREDFQELCLDMAKTMKDKDGIGLAAPQIGENIRLIVINTKNGIICLINPQLKRKSFGKEWGEEGCLSLPGIYGKVKRHKKIVCVYLNQRGKKQKIQAEGLLARVIQHEIDHLDGILFIDKAKNIQEVDVL